jgi:ribosomal protein S18 acetylase RimI-like enzyme
MDRSLTLRGKDAPVVSLRSIGPGDLEELRVWKNANTQAFFFKGQIDPAMQAKWYAGYRGRAHDHMFIVEHGGAKAGCMGFRVEPDGSVDTYNMIAAPQSKGKGLMKAAMRLMCSYIAQKHGKDIGCLVVMGNPAVKYYESCGYSVVGEKEGHHVLKLDWARFKPVPYEVQEKP